MSEKPSNELPKIKELENRIDELRCSLLTLIIAVILLSGYMVLQIIQQLSIYEFLFFSSFGMIFVALLVLLLIASICSATAAGKHTEKVVSSPRLEPPKE